ncbi:hypothetical protein L3Q82_009189 [Scortum barcoo]|uniref:Uncharacterized protein n=1 Tax=Scortum barcoo TaxID=214431 RepID=A0ACB8WH30_9TELE|nr:hypothetical protein L3Q82_009189 [Scortum barcoo]
MSTTFEHKGVHQCTEVAELSTDHHLVESWIRWRRRKLDRPGRPKRLGRALCQGGLQLPPPEELSPRF